MEMTTHCLAALKWILIFIFCLNGELLITQGNAQGSWEDKWEKCLDKVKA